MERPYIWFQTGLGCTVAAIGTIGATVALVLVLDWAAGSLWLQLAIAVAVCALAVLPAFVIDRRLIGRRRTSSGYQVPAGETTFETRR